MINRVVSSRVRVWCRSRRAGTIWICVLVASWVICFLSSRIGIPSIDPSITVQDRPLEQLGTACVLFVGLVNVFVLREPVAWLVATSPLRLRYYRTLWLAFNTVLGLMFSVLTYPIFPQDVPIIRIATLWVLGFSFGVFALVIFGHNLAFLGPFAVLLLFSTPKLVPWHLNLIYNVEVAKYLGVFTLCSYLSSVILFALKVDRQVI